MGTCSKFCPPAQKPVSEIVYYMDLCYLRCGLLNLMQFQITSAVGGIAIMTPISAIVASAESPIALSIYASKVLSR